jgi:hypothetical protein
MVGFVRSGGGCFFALSSKAVDDPQEELKEGEERR